LMTHISKTSTDCYTNAGRLSASHDLPQPSRN
jgi:hypothetical protein